MFNVIPDHTFANNTPIQLPGYQTLKDTAPSPSDQQLTLSAANAPIPFGYGRMRFGPKVANVLTDASGAMLVDCLLAEGQLDSLIAMEVNDAAAPSGVTVIFYDGTQTLPDGTLAAAWALQGVVYTDVRPGVSYAIIKVPSSVDLSIDERSITFEAKLRRVYDPRDGTQDVSDPSTWKWSANPALALADFLASPKLGPGDTVDWASVSDAADRCDEAVGGAPRNTIGTLFTSQVNKGDVEEVLRGAAMCFVAREGPVTYLVADAPVDLSTTLHLQPADWQTTSLRYSEPPADQVRNSVSVRYTNTTVKPWAEAYTDPPLLTPEVVAGMVDELTTVINGTWIQNYPEGVRLQQRYFAQYTLGLKTIEFDAFEKAWAIRRGDVIRLSNDADLVEKAIRVQKIMPLGFARVHIVGQEYDSAMYSDDAPAAPTTVTSSFQDPSNVIAPPGPLGMVEEVYLDQSQGSTIATGAKYLSRFRLSWTHTTDRYRLDYVVELFDGTTMVLNNSTVTNEAVTGPLEQGKLYRAEVRTRNVLGFLSTPIVASVTALGKLLPPGPVPFANGRELGGKVLLSWGAAIDIDTLRYEWRFTPNQTVGGAWDAATFIDRVDGLTVAFEGLPTGTHRFYVRAVDSVGKYSVSDCTVDITITSDANAFLQNKLFGSPVAVNDTQLAMVCPPIWAVGTTGFASTPDIAKNSVTGDIDLRVDVWIPPGIASTASLISKFPQAGGQQSYKMQIASNGQLGFSWTSDGSTLRDCNSSVNVPNFAAGGRFRFRTTLDVDNGSGGHVARLYTGQETGGSGLTQWTQLGTDQNAGAFTTSIFDGTSILRVGVRDETTGLSPALGCRIYRALVMNGIDGTAAADFYPARDASGENVASIVSALTGETWTASYPPTIRRAGLGSSGELVSNGMFAAAGSWSLGTGWSISGGAGVATAATGQITQVGILTPGKLYRIVVTVLSIAGGQSLKVFCGGGNLSAPITAAGTYVFYMQAVQADCGVTAVGTTTAQVDNFSVVECNNIESIPMLEGIWTPRWQTDFASDQWNSVMPNPLNSSANPVASFHASGTSRWQGEWWDLGVTVSGAWALTPNQTVINGSISDFIETSPDGTIVTRQPGISWQGSTRFVRPAMDALTTGSMRIDGRPELRVEALTRSESGVVTTSASVPTLIQLTGAYAFLQDLQATCINKVGGSVTSRTADADRILLNPQTGLMHQFTYTGAGDAATTQEISQVARVILSDDFIEYDVFIDPLSPVTTGFSNGGLFITFSDTTGNSASVAADGFATFAPAVGFDSLARGQWFSRKASMAAFAGKTTAHFYLSEQGDAASGIANILFRNIRFTNGSGTDRQTVWSSGEPTINSTAVIALVTNIQCGPSNSFQLYAFTTATGAQVASDVRWGVDAV